MIPLYYRIQTIAFPKYPHNRFLFVRSHLTPYLCNWRPLYQRFTGFSHADLLYSGSSICLNCRAICSQAFHLVCNGRFPRIVGSFSKLLTEFYSGCTWAREHPCDFAPSLQSIYVDRLYKPRPVSITLMSFYFKFIDRWNFLLHSIFLLILLPGNF